MREFLDNVEYARPTLARCGFHDTTIAHRNFVRLAQLGLPLDLLQTLVDDLLQYLPGSADPDMAFNNFERLLANTRSPLSMLTFLERKPHSLAVLLQLFAASQYFSNLIIENPDYFDYVWENGSLPLDPEILKDEILAELRSVNFDHDHVLATIRRCRGREMLRIGFRDIIGGEPLDRITRSISDLADCLVEVALAVAYRRQSSKWGEPRSADGKYSRLVVLGLGKLGGQELNYSSDIDLIIIYEDDGQTDGKAPHEESVPNSHFFTSVVQDMVGLLSASTSHGFAYRVDLRLRPHGGHAALCQSLASTLAYYDRYGRTWERQALVKARPIAGYKQLGQRFLRGVESFIYRRYLTFLEINEIKAIKRQIERTTKSQGRDATNIKTGRGGIRDIEFVVQFLQLLNGGVHPELREQNTLRALRRLVSTGCLNQDEHAALETAYRFLRKAEHRLQFMFDLQKHSIPDSLVELDKLAVRLGYVSGSSVRPGEEFLSDLRAITERNRTIQRHLMSDLFPEGERDSSEGMPESDLVLDPQPPVDRIEQVLGPYRFTNVREAHKNLALLGTEEVPFLSSIRSRHFLASIAPSLLRAVSEAPDPDMALVNLEKVTHSLGAKGALWESLSHNPPLLQLYVHLCSWSQFLSEILINNPGMIDELLDTLVMNRQPTRDELAAELASLLKGAEDIHPILHSFKNTTLLGIGVNDILGKRTIVETTRSLSDLAEVIVSAITAHHHREMIERYGQPMLKEFPGQVSQFALIGLGKLGGAELGYHGDLDLVLIYEGDGTSAHRKGSTNKKTLTNFEFFTELVQRVIKTCGLTAAGKLYTIDLRLRPTGRSGSVVSPLFRFENYYRENAALWERQVLTRGRIIYGSFEFTKRIEAAILEAIVGHDWSIHDAQEIQSMRNRLEESRPATDIKRGRGGESDVEFAVQLAQLQFGREIPSILKPNLWEAIDELEKNKLWTADRCRIMREGYTLLRMVESRLRIVYNQVRNDLPNDSGELDKLAQRCGYPNGDRLMEDLLHTTNDIRTEFLACTGAESSKT